MRRVLVQAVAVVLLLLCVLRPAESIRVDRLGSRHTRRNIDESQFKAALDDLKEHTEKLNDAIEKAQTEIDAVAKKQAAASAAPVEKQQSEQSADEAAGSANSDNNAAASMLETDARLTRRAAQKSIFGTIASGVSDGVAASLGYAKKGASAIGRGASNVYDQRGAIGGSVLGGLGKVAAVAGPGLLAGASAIGGALAAGGGGAFLQPGAAVGARAGFTGASRRLTPVDQQCVLCQYFVQRIRGELVQLAQPGIWLEESEQSSSKAAPAAAAASSSSEQPGWLRPEFVDDGSLAKAVEAAADDTLAAAHEALAVEQLPAGAKLREDAAAPPTSDDHADGGGAKPAPAAAAQKHDHAAAHKQQKQTAVRFAEKPPVVSAAPPARAHDHSAAAAAAAPRSTHTLRQMERGLQMYKEKLQARLLELEERHVARKQQQQQQKQQPAAAESFIESAATARDDGDGDEQQPQSDDAVPGVMPRRYRATDVRTSRPTWSRYENTNPPSPNPMREQARYQYQVLQTLVYQSFVRLCTVRMPQPFYDTCTSLVNQYQQVAEGLHYGDRPDEVCIRAKFCPSTSYIVNSPHAVLREGA